MIHAPTDTTSRSSAQAKVFCPRKTCTRCQACQQPGQYFSRGCTGTELSPERTCSDCLTPCPAGSYIAQGCNGSTTWPHADRCLPCSPCGASPLEYILTPCSGKGVLPTGRACARCTCPLGFTPYTLCQRSGTVDHVCINANGALYYPPSYQKTLPLTTPASSRLQTTLEATTTMGSVPHTSPHPSPQTSTVSDDQTSTEAMEASTTPPPESTPEGGFTNVGLIAGATVGAIGGAAVVVTLILLLVPK